jgi:PIN domain nuclease of toxin-antitoxin system
MTFLLDTQLLLWSGNYPELLSSAVVSLIHDPANALVFSTVSVWEVAIKFGRGRADFQVEPSLFRRELFAADFRELPVLGEHAVAVAALPGIHKDPFDRILIAQAMVEGITLLTSDAVVAQYPGSIRRV